MKLIKPISINGSESSCECTNNQLRDIFNAAIGKFQQGAVKYGDYDPLTDNRDMLAETEAEILDAINYLAMGLIKLRALKRKRQFPAEGRRVKVRKAVHGA